MRTSLLMVVGMVCFLSTSVFGLGLGPPTAELSKGQWSVGGDYAYSDMELDASRWKHTNSSGDPVLMLPFEFEDVKTSFYTAILGYGLTDNLEVYGRLGTADIKGRGIWTSTNWGLNFDNDFVWGLGARLTLCEQEKVRWGVTAQMNWIDTSWDREETSIDYGQIKRTLDLSAYDLMVAVGPTVDMGGWKLYGGPFYYMFDGDFDYIETWTGDGGGWEKGSADLDEEDSFGGYIGAQIDLCKSCKATIEFATTCGNLWSVGAGLTFLTK